MRPDSSMVNDASTVSVLVTGGAGFIGSELAKKLLSKGIRVVVIDDLSTGFVENVPEGCEFIEGDCGEAETISKLNRAHFEVIYHIAGQSSGEVSFESPITDLRSNVQSTLLLLDYARETGCENFVYASSMSVYGSANVIPAKEDGPTKPSSFYAVGKLASEQYMEVFHKEYGLRTVALRFFNVYGPGQNLKNLKQGMASIYLAQAIKNRKVLVKGSPDRFRDFVYIDDVIDCIEVSGNSDLQGVFNICTGKPVKVHEVLSAIGSGFHEPLEITYAEETPGDMFGIYGDPSNFIHASNKQCSISFQEGMKRMLHWAQNFEEKQ